MNFCTLISDLPGTVFVTFWACLLQMKMLQGDVNFFEDASACEITCSTDKIHTMCETEPDPECDEYTRFTIFTIPDMADGRLFKLLLDGHNGLRDRIANKMNVANMVKLDWDPLLSEMALKYFQKCTPYIDDPCTLFVSDLTCLELLEYKEEDIELYRYVSQNRFKIRADNLPAFFIETALRSWYYEKNKMKKPIYNISIYHGSSIGIIQEETNFTHLAYPLTSHFGCGIAQIDAHYELICNYYPYYRTKDSEVIFINGTGASSCPAIYPIPSDAFVSLCCDGQELWDALDNAGGSASALLSSSFHLFVLAGLLLRNIKCLRHD